MTTPEPHSPRFAKPSTRYINEFLRLRCGPDLLEAGLFPNGKEITESFAAFAAAGHLDNAFNLKDEGVRCFVIGDGVVPRTGALFACRSQWQITSIDPQMYTDRSNPFERLKRVNCRIEDLAPLTCDKALIVLVHSHAYPPACFKRIKARTRLGVIAIPCCVRLEEINGAPPDIAYEDSGIWSPKQTVKIWRNIADR